MHEAVIITASVVSLIQGLPAMLKQLFTTQGAQTGSPPCLRGALGKFFPHQYNEGNNTWYDWLQSSRSILVHHLKEPFLTFEKAPCSPCCPGKSIRCADAGRTEGKILLWNSISTPQKMTVQRKLFWTELLNQNLPSVNAATRRKKTQLFNITRKKGLLWVKQMIF